MKGNEKKTTTTDEAMEEKKTSRNSSRNARRRSEGKTADNFKGSSNQSSAIALTATQLITAANLGYGYPLGVQIDDLAALKGCGVANSLGIPAIAGYYVDPHIGRSADATSKANLAAHRLYTSFVYANGRSPAYDVPDALIAPLAVGQCAAFYHFACRVYRTMNTFLTDNRTLPHAMAKVQCIDYADFHENLADFAHWLEDYRLMLKTLFLPGNLPIISEWCSTFDDVYLDEGANPKAQMFMFVPKSFFKYDPTMTTEGGGLRRVPYAVWDNNLGEYGCYTYAQFKAYGDALITALIYDQDINKIQADIMLSYGPQAVADVYPVTLGEPLEFKLDALVSATIHNSSLLGGMTMQYPHITQDAQGRIIHTPYWEGEKKNVLPLLGAKFFDSPTAEVNPLLNATMSRLISIAPKIQHADLATLKTHPGYLFSSSTPEAWFNPSVLGVYSINDMVVVKTVGGGTPGAWGLWYPSNSLGTTDADASVWIDKMMEAFKMAPIFEKYNAVSTAAYKAATDTSAFTLSSLVGEINFYTIVNEATLKQIMDTYIFAQLSAGLVG